jgi:hypothetical protein
MRFCSKLLSVGLLFAVLAPAGMSQEKKDGDKAGKVLFDGKTLQGWSGIASNWRVEDGAITGENTADAPISGNTFLVYERNVSNFDLQLEFRIRGGNSGIQYRSQVMDKEKFVVGGYQADIDASKRFMGINYEERGRAIIAERGEIIAIASDGTKSRVGSCGDTDALLSSIKWEDWNQYRIVARGNVLQHFINGNLVSEVTDMESSKAASDGVLALQLHAGPPMIVQFRNIVLTDL